MKNVFYALIVSFLVIGCNQGVVPPNEELNQKLIFPDVPLAEIKGDENGRTLNWAQYCEDFACNYFSYPENDKGYLYDTQIFFDREGNCPPNMNYANSAPWYLDNATPWVSDTSELSPAYMGTYKLKLAPGGIAAMLFNLETFLSNPEGNNGGINSDLETIFKEIRMGFWNFDNLSTDYPHQQVHIFVEFNNTGWNYWHTVSWDSYATSFKGIFPFILHKGDLIRIGIMADANNQTDVEAHWLQIHNEY